jgi:hypothetical protein
MTKEEKEDNIWPVELSEKIEISDKVEALLLEAQKSLSDSHNVGTEFEDQETLLAVTKIQESIINAIIHNRKFRTRLNDE